MSRGFVCRFGYTIELTVFILLGGLQPIRKHLNGNRRIQPTMIAVVITLTTREKLLAAKITQARILHYPAQLVIPKTSNRGKRTDSTT
jgi:hypothetical protein